MVMNTNNPEQGGEIKFYTDTVHGFNAMARSRTMAWQLIRNECHEKGLEVPTMDKVIEVNKPEQCEGCKGDEKEKPKERNYLILYYALQKVAMWMLPETGRFWDDAGTQPVSYEAQYGSNGVRDYFKRLASDAIESFSQPAKINKEKKQGDCLECGEDLEHPFATGYHKNCVDKVFEREQGEREVVVPDEILQQINARSFTERWPIWITEQYLKSFTDGYKAGINQKEKPR